MESLRFPVPVLLLVCGLASGQTVDFQREIRPVLAENCFQCHGPDAASRMAGLRLDLKESASRVLDKIYPRISSPDVNRRMPPAASHRSLTPAQIARIKLWIDQGAAWQEFWAYKAPVQAAPPQVRDAAWVRNPIDRFILAKLEAKGLTPAPQADRRTLLRRVALDLTGLPPTPAELETFLADSSPNAYEKMVDRYLASPHFGEQRARYWLDAARYGDTHGIHIDNYREIWPYRDWVIAAYNRNLPYDRFAIEQLAGDLLPNPTLEQKIATGFMRCGVTTNEAGIIEDEYAEIYAKDRAETFGAVFLGMTVGCATCHDHKFDPITQKDFYSLGAFFRNTTQKVMDDNVPDTPPVVVVPEPKDRAAWDQTTARLRAIRVGMNQAESESAEAYTKWLAARAGKPLPAPLGDKTEIFAAKAPEPGKDGASFPDAPKLDADKPFSITVSFYFPKEEQGYTIAAHANPKDKNRGWTLDVGARVPGFRLTGDSGRSIEIRAAHLQQLQPGSWNRIAVSYDGSRRQSGLAFYMNGRAVPTQGRGNQVTDLSGDIGLTDVPLVLGGKSMAEGSIVDFRIVNRGSSANGLL
jgi:hypothetical protein